ncbi:hypothetical protein ASZ90_018031 [hydrocarbon metagenome]|uniref:Cell wall-active antibiotics response LiaF-like C-terminal domain-containing protein n=1 Tax=hydrocarbon metagenome TaxID=938273 RepID=A0A0W8E7G4_9ZZZZ
MKFSNEYFWGILLVVLGIIIILRNYFNINIPIFRSIFAFILIYLGVMTLFGGFAVKSGDMMLFNEGTIKVTDNAPEYNILFSSGTIDLSRLKTDSKPESIKVNVIFSNGKILVGPDLPLVIKLNSAFANSSFPDGSSINFGDHTYRTSASDESDPIFVEVSVVFGRVAISNISPDSL